MILQPKVVIYSAFALLAIFPMGCSQKPTTIPFQELPPLPVEESVVPPTVPTATRFGLDQNPRQEPVSTQERAQAKRIDRESTTSNALSREPNQIRWKAPAGWQRAEDRPMRIVTFRPSDTRGTECAVSVLVGEAGGVVPNLNRWRSQLGLPPLMEADIASLETLEILGVRATFMECTGPQQNLDAPPPALLGLICPLPTYTVFVKMMGPAPEVHGERDRFMAFVQSLYFDEAEHP